MTNVPVPLTVPPVTVLPGGLLDRNRLARDHRLVDRRRAVDHDAIDRNALAGPHAQAIADVHVLERNVALGAVGVDTAGRLGARPKQVPDRRARPRLRARSSST